MPRIILTIFFVLMGSLPLFAEGSWDKWEDMPKCPSFYIGHEEADRKINALWNKSIEDNIKQLLARGDQAGARAYLNECLKNYFENWELVVEELASKQLNEFSQEQNEQVGQWMSKLMLVVSMINLRLSKYIEEYDG